MDGILSSGKFYPPNRNIFFVLYARVRTIMAWMRESAGNLKFPTWHSVITLTLHNYARNLGHIILHACDANSNELR